MSIEKTDHISMKQADTLAGVFVERVTRSPDKIAYIQYDQAQDKWLEITWAEMGRRVARWQAALQ